MVWSHSSWQHKRIAKGNPLSNVRLVETRKEKFNGHIGVTSERVLEKIMALLG
jgi:hypothetical protein